MRTPKGATTSTIMTGIWQRLQFLQPLLALLILLPALALLPAVRSVGANANSRVDLPPRDTPEGYLAMLLVNETPFPGERGWVSEEDTKGAMLAILHVLDSRLRHVPPGYTQQQIASQRCTDIIDVITAGGEKGQCDGFHRDASGRFVAVPRVHERIAYLVGVASKGEPGRFARLLEYASTLSKFYVSGGMEEADRFAELKRVGNTPVTGRAYSWMTDTNNYNPGGNFVRIPDANNGALGGNRFFTLKEIK